MKYLSTILLFCIFIGINSCNVFERNKINDVMERYVEAYNEHDSDKIKQMFLADELSFTEESALWWSMKTGDALEVKITEYEVTDLDINGDKASLTFRYTMEYNDSSLVGNVVKEIDGEFPKEQSQIMNLKKKDGKWFLTKH